MTDKYSWKEDQDFIHVTSALGRGTTSDELEVSIEKDSMRIIKKGAKIPIIEGCTRGKIDVDGTFWTIEDNNGIKELLVTLKKADTSRQKWFGVLVGEVAQYKNYSGKDSQESMIKCQSKESGGVFWNRTFERVNADELRGLFLRWVSRDATDMIPYGRPKTEVEFKFVPTDVGGKLLFVGIDLDEYVEVVFKKAGDSSELLLINGPSARIFAGEFGKELSDKLVKSLNIFIQRFENDAVKLISLMSNTGGTRAEYDYAGSNAFLGTENFDGYVRYHESLRERLGMPLSYKISNDTEPFKDEKLGVTVDWGSAPSKDITLEENIKTKKKLLNELTEAIKHAKKEQPLDTMKSLIKSFKDIALTDREYQEFLDNIVERIENETTSVQTKQDDISNMKEDDEWFKEQMDVNIADPSSTDTFDMMVKDPYNINNCVLVRKYHSISPVKQEQLRKRWKGNEKRLKLLLVELFQASDNNTALLICNKYRDLLISEDYPSLMKSYLLTNAVEDENQRDRLSLLNEFVLSIYKDAEIYTCQDEQNQLNKIRQICNWAINDFEKINDYVEANKHLYDLNFMTYLRLAIAREIEKIQDESNTSLMSPDPRKTPWLCVLSIIERAITSLIEADMAEDIYVIGLIVDQKYESVRSYMLELILATMPRSDWKHFKDLILSIAGALDNKTEDEKKFEDAPSWLTEACYQLRDEVEGMIPDWLIDELLSEADRQFMVENNKKRSPVLRLDLREYVENRRNDQIRKIKVPSHLLHKK